MCTADPKPQTHIDPVTAAHAMHAEPNDSTSQSLPLGAAAATARYVLAAHTSAMHCCCIKQLRLAWTQSATLFSLMWIVFLPRE